MKNYPPKEAVLSYFNQMSGLRSRITSKKAKLAQDKKLCMSRFTIHILVSNQNKLKE